MRKTMVEILHLKHFSSDIYLESPQFNYVTSTYTRTYETIVTGSPVHRTTSYFLSYRFDVDIARPVFTLNNSPTDYWFQNVTRSYWA